MGPRSDQTLASAPTTAKGTTPSPIVGASREIIAHHAAQHACPDVGPCRVRACPCGRALAIHCAWCELPVFVVAAPGVPYCEHLREAVA